jgi:hypothetical protein
MSWQVVTTHFEGDKISYRAVQYNEAHVIVKERKFLTEEDANNYILKLTSEEK